MTVPVATAPRRFRAACVAGLLPLLAACSTGAGGSTRSPTGSVDYPWQAIAAPQSMLLIAGPEDHRHRARRLGGRYQEVVSFGSGGGVWYEYLEGHRMTFGVTGRDLIKSWYGGKSASEAGFVFHDNAVRRDAESFTATDTAGGRSCALYGRVFGAVQDGFGNGDQLYLIDHCVPAGDGALARAERIVQEIAGRLQATPIFARPLPSLSPSGDAPSAGLPQALVTPVAAAAETTASRPALAQAPATPAAPESDHLCSSSRLHSLYHAGTCWAGDHEATRSEIDAFRTRYRSVMQAGANEAALRVPAPGTRISNSIRGYRDYLALDGPLVVFRAANGRIFSSVGGLVTLDAESTLPVEQVAALWPLRIGKSVSYVVSDKSNSWDVVLQVLRRETVTVKAGSFDSFVIEMHQKGRNNNTHESYRRFWYAPAAGGVVKYDVQLVSGTTNAQAWEAVSITVPGGAPAPATTAPPPIVAAAPPSIAAPAAVAAAPAVRPSEAAPPPASPPSAASARVQKVVALEPEGGTFVVPVLINGAITLRFTLDSGASDVSIPADVFMTLVRAGTIVKADFLGEKTYVLADGSKMPSQQFRIRSLKVGDVELTNVRGSIAPMQGSLLLGQSFLSRLNSWSVDNRRHALVME